MCITKQKLHVALHSYLQTGNWDEIRVRQKGRRDTGTKESHRATEARYRGSQPRDRGGQRAEQPCSNDHDEEPGGEAEESAGPEREAASGGWSGVVMET